MKIFTRITFVLLATVFSITVANGKEHTLRHFGLSDSCWQVFLSQLSGGDSSLGGNLDTVSTLDTQIDSMMKLLPGLRGKAVQALQKQIIALRKERNTLRQQINMIFSSNAALLADIRANCGRDSAITDTTDTTGGGGGGGTNDSLTISLNPNPLLTGGSLNLNFTLANDANVTVNVFSQTTSTLVQTFSYPGLLAGSQTLVLNLGALPPGSYLIQVQAGSLVGTATLLIL